MSADNSSNFPEGNLPVRPPKYLGEITPEEAALYELQRRILPDETPEKSDELPVRPPKYLGKITHEEAELYRRQRRELPEDEA